jgi:hypothetical protein
MRPAFVLALACVLFAAAPAAAGERPLELLLGNMSPDGSRPDCMRDVVRELRRRDDMGEVNLSRMGEGGIRRLAGHDDDSSFLSWSIEDLRPILERRRETPLDAIALIDCRAEGTEADAAEALVLSPAGGLMRLRLRGRPIDPERAAWLGRSLLHHAWMGFSP